MLKLCKSLVSSRLEYKQLEAINWCPVVIPTESTKLKIEECPAEGYIKGFWVSSSWIYWNRRKTLNLMSM